MPTNDQFTTVTRPHQRNPTIITPDRTIPPTPFTTNNRYVINELSDDDSSTNKRAPPQDDDDDFLFLPMSAPAESPTLTAFLLSPVYAHLGF